MSARGSHRLFVAVDPPGEVAAALAGWARAQRGGAEGLRVVPPGNVHLTLAFLGERTAADVDPVARAVGAAVAEWAFGGGRGPVTLELGPPAWLPPRRPRVLAIDVRDPSGQLAALQAAVGTQLRDAVGWEPEHRRFRPHLTAARLGGRPQAPGALDPTPAGGFAVSEVVVYRSFLAPAGARYEALERIPLT